MIRGVNLLGSKLKRKALLSFLEAPINRAVQGEVLFPFSNLGLAVELVRGLNESGYLVDVVNWDSLDVPKSEKYDLLVGHGGINFTTITRSNSIKKIVYFATGSAASFHNREATKRSAAFYKRHGVKYPPDRPVDKAETKAYSASASIVCLGNKHVAQTFAPHTKVLNLNIAASPKNKIWFERAGRKAQNFLFFSGGGNLHKGLDLAIEAMIGTDLQLHICTSIEPSFQAFYENKYSTTELQNIHWHGFVAQKSRTFRHLIRISQFAVLLSCSEGSPGSLIDVMQYGLIPIVTPACGLDITNIGLEVSSTEIDKIRKQFIKASKIPAAELDVRSSKVKTLVADKFSVVNFQKSLHEILAKAAI